MQQTGFRAEEFWRYVVRIEADSAGATGFFVAPGIVLTCAHVVGEAARVIVVPADKTVADTTTARVVARSPAREYGEFWPYPDLAILEIEDKTVRHSSVRLELEPEEPSYDAACLAWGYSIRDDSVDATGSPASFWYEGRERDGRFKLKWGQAAPGLSGAPLVCRVRRAVVGVVSMSRNVNADIGGYASPVAALFTDPTLSDDLKTWGRHIRTANRVSFRQERERWHAVLPLRDADKALAPGYSTLRPVRGTQPSDLLRADYCVTPYMFRDEVLADAVAWCKASESMQLCRVIGRAGAGKTRFAIELCKQMFEAGWVAGFWRKNSSIADFQVPRLVVFDYDETYEAKDFCAALEILRESANYAAPVQVLVLTHPLGRSSTDIFDTLDGSGALQLILDAKHEEPGATARLSIMQRRQLYSAAITEFGRYRTFFNDDALPTADIDAPIDLADDRYELPLDVLFEALDTALGGVTFSDRSSKPVERVLVRVRKYWRGKIALDDDRLRCFVAAATLAGAADAKEARALISVVDDFDDPLDVPAAR
jgi:hypothetical protein